MEKLTQSIKNLQALALERDRILLNLVIQIATLKSIETAIQKTMIDIDMLSANQDDPPLSVIALEVIEMEKSSKYPPAKF